MNQIGKGILIIALIVIILECVFLIKNSKDKEVGYFVYNDKGTFV